MTFTLGKDDDVEGLRWVGQAGREGDIANDGGFDIGVDINGDDRTGGTGEFGWSQEGAGADGGGV